MRCWWRAWATGPSRRTGSAPRPPDYTLVTRHLVEQVPEQFGAFRPVSALAAGVLGTTGMESGELISAVVEKTLPACVLAVDALASRSLRRVGRTVQLSDTGIVPGSGVGNHRMALNRETLGVPVIAIGVPTVVDAATLACDLLSEAGREDLDPAALSGAGENLIVTPREVDTQVGDLAQGDRIRDRSGAAERPGRGGYRPAAELMRPACPEGFA